MKYTHRIAYRLCTLLLVTRFERWLSLINLTVAMPGPNGPITIPLRGGLNRFLLRKPSAWVDHLYRSLLPTRRGLFIDVGTNYAQTLILFLRAGAHQMTYVGIEPVPECCAYVRLVAGYNGVNEANVVCAALGAESGVAQLRCVEISGFDSVMSTLEESLCNDDVYRDFLPVPKFTGDELLRCKEFGGPIGFLKIDVEGFELEVLRGMLKSIEKDRPLILCEVMPGNHAQLESRNKRKAQIEMTTSLVAELGYDILHARHDGSLLAVEALPTTDWSSTMSEGYDFLFVPSELRGSVEAAHAAQIV